VFGARIWDRRRLGVVAAVALAVVAVGSVPADATVGRSVGDAIGTRTRQAGVVVRVLSLGCGGMALGSGVVVPGGRVLTNRHVVAGATYVEVRRFDGVRIGARIERIARDVDLALLWAGEAVGAGIEPRGRLRPDQPVSVLGHPAGGTAVRTAGTVTARIWSGGEPVGAAWVSAAVAPGSSGGPAFTGPELVGVVYALEQRTGLAGVIDGDTAAGLVAGTVPWLPQVGCEREPPG
jgi:S1-C subfamily serine protease